MNYMHDAHACHTHRRSTLWRHVLQGLSFALFWINVAAIYVTGLIFFKVKEVAPLRFKSAFWQVCIVHELLRDCCITIGEALRYERCAQELPRITRAEIEHKDLSGVNVTRTLNPQNGMCLHLHHR